MAPWWCRRMTWATSPKGRGWFLVILGLMASDLSSALRITGTSQGMAPLGSPLTPRESMLQPPVVDGSKANGFSLAFMARSRSHGPSLAHLVAGEGEEGCFPMEVSSTTAAPHPYTKATNASMHRITRQGIQPPPVCTFCGCGSGSLGASHLLSTCGGGDELREGCSLAMGSTSTGMHAATAAARGQPSPAFFGSGVGQLAIKCSADPHR